jgi:MYXO-CTERM domain-containing protein
MSLKAPKLWLCGLLVLGCAGRSTNDDAPASDEPGGSSSATGGKPSDQTTPGPRATARIAPEIPDVSSVDRDADRVHDELGAELALLERAVSGASGASPALADEAATGVAELARPIRVSLHFGAPVTEAALATFAAHGGVQKKVYGGVGYALVGTLPRARVRALAAALGPSLLLLSGGRRLVAHLDEATRTGRVRPIWASSFAAGLSFTGSSSVNIGIVDSGIDDTHTDLTGRQELWIDCTSDASTTADDFSGHGTHVAGIALGSGAGFGTGPGTLRYTDGGDLTGVSSGFFPNTLHLPATSLTFSGQATFLGGGSTTLTSVGASDGTSSWAQLGGTTGTGTSPQSFSVTFTPSTGSHYSTALLAPVSHYAVAASVTNYPAVGDGFPALRGVASSSRWAGFKVFAKDGSGSSLDLFDALQSVLDNAALHSLKVVNLSLGIEGSGQTDPTLRSAVNTLVSNGIVIVVSAGNAGPSGVVSDPGRARLAITVGASSDQNRVTEYSSIGFTPTVTSEGSKPDVLAPGGSTYRSMILSPDTNDSDADLESFADRRQHDYALKQGTSMAAPFVAGSAALVIQSLESTGVSWSFAGPDQPLFVKMMLSAAATETAGAREGGGGNDPALGRAGVPRDPSEGFGIVNPDAAVEALRVALDTGFSGATSGGVFERRAWGRKVDLIAGNELEVSLDVTSGADFDVYLYDGTPHDAGTSSAEGVPNRVASATAGGIGADESLSYTPESAGTRYLFVKRVAGSGSFTLTAKIPCGDGNLDAGEACDDGNQSSSDCCSATCQVINAGIACDDGDACTQTDTCQSGACTGSNPVVCNASDQCHAAGTCDSITGSCSNPVAGNGTSCNDGDACTTADACSAGVCTPGGTVTCSAADACHAAGTCDPSTGACSNPELGDGTPCSGGKCESGTCVPDPVTGGAGGQAGGGGGGGTAGRAGGTGGGAGSSTGGIGGGSGSGGAGNAGGRVGTGGSAGSGNAGAVGGTAGDGSSGDGGRSPATGGLDAAGGAVAAGSGSRPDDAGESGEGPAGGGLGAAGHPAAGSAGQAATAGAGTQPPAPTTPASSARSTGCGCNVPDERGSTGYAALGLLGLFATAARRRRRTTLRV